jgi:hypothetical protein
MPAVLSPAPASPTARPGRPAAAACPAASARLQYPPGALRAAPGWSCRRRGSKPLPESTP